jgi:hypothetical protein
MKAHTVNTASGFSVVSFYPLLSLLLELLNQLSDLEWILGLSFSSLLTPDRPSTPPPTTWSSWVENMSRLSALTDDAEAIAASADTLDRWLITYQVSELRRDLEKQRERFTALLRLIKEYADMVLLDISEEIQQQSSLLDSLERRLDMVKILREEVVHLRKSYEVEALDPIKKPRRAGM